jgi:hypothetical protein
MINRISILILLMITQLLVKGQEIKLERRDLNLGFELVGPINSFIQPSRTALEISAKAGGFKKFYIASEIGILKINEKKTNSYNYYSSGQYFRVGFDYNMFKRNLPDENNLVFIGLRYGMAFLNHSADHIVITDVKWGDFQAADIPKTKVHAGWVEVTGGLKAGIVNHFSIGWSVSYRKLMTTTGMKKIKPFLIPGFGEGSVNTSWGFSYTVYYDIPISNKPVLKSSK